jgi:ABC-type branched-subunit amino acid transport system substrate-binding protein
VLGGEDALRRISLALHLGDREEAQRLLGELRGDSRAQAQRMLDAADALRVVDPRVVGVLLPLSGPYAKLGQELKIALELAAQGEPHAVLAFHDTAGSPQGAETGVDDLLHQVRPIVIVGPVGEVEAEAAARRAVFRGVPIALLSPVELVANAELAVFRLMASEEERAAAAARAASALGYERPAVFAPRDEHGVAQTRAFAEAAARAGIPVTRTGYYDPTASELEPDVKAFLGLDPRKNARLRRHLAKHPRDGWKTFVPDVDFDLLFVPDVYEHASLVAAFLRFYNVELRSGLDPDALVGRRAAATLVQLFGSSGWHDPRLLLRGQADVEGAYLVDVCPEMDEGEAGTFAIFAERFAAAVGRPPSRVAAQAYDAMGMVLSARRRAVAAGGAPRTTMARALATERVVSGACGPARVNVQGELDRDMALYRIEGGDFVKLEAIE